MQCTLTHFLFLLLWFSLVHHLFQIYQKHLLVMEKLNLKIDNRITTLLRNNTAVPQVLWYLSHMVKWTYSNLLCVSNQGEQQFFFFFFRKRKNRRLSRFSVLKTCCKLGFTLSHQDREKTKCESYYSYQTYVRITKSLCKSAVKKDLIKPGGQKYTEDFATCSTTQLTCW